MAEGTTVTIVVAGLADTTVAGIWLLCPLGFKGCRLRTVAVWCRCGGWPMTVVVVVVVDTTCGATEGVVVVVVGGAMAAVCAGVCR